MNGSKRRRNSRIAIALFAALVCVSPVSALDSSNVESLIASLKKGGNIIYLRHAATEPEGRDSDRINLNNCSKQ